MSMISRPDVSGDAIAHAFTAVAEALSKRLEQHGHGAYAGPHEIDGVLDEEVREWKDAVRANDVSGRRNELVDVAVTAVFGLASLETLNR